MVTASKAGLWGILLVLSAAAVVSGLAVLAAQEPVRQVTAPHEGHTGKAPKADQPAATIVADLPPPELLAEGVAIVRFRTENLQLVPVFGPAAAAVSPRIGHLHVTLDDAPWHWAHTSGDPVIVAPLPPGPHTLLLELADADHKVLAREVVKFEVPRR